MTIPRSARRLRALGAALGALVLTASLAACTSTDPATQAFREGTNQGYISGDGQVVEIPETDRGEPVDFTGMSDADEEISGKDLRGQVVVVNFWYAACGPCRVEAKDLEAVYQDYKDKGATFVGVNTSDQAETAQSFAKTYGVTYPSIIDQGDGAVKIAFAQDAPLQATPTTLVLDKQGRVAARVIGPIDGTSVLGTLVRELTEAP